jgi:hypothetical protein
MPQEDLWAQLMADMTDFSVNSTRGPDVRKRGVARTAREMIEQLCLVESPMFAQMPKMYTVAECFDGHTADGRLCVPSALHKLSTEAGHKRRWYVLRAADGPFDEDTTALPALAQAAFASVCLNELLPAEPEITEAITGRFNARKRDFNKLAKATENVNITAKLDKARKEATDVLGHCMPTKPEDPVPEDCEAQLEDAHEELVKVNATRNKVESKYKKALKNMADLVAEGKTIIGSEACVEVCQSQDKTKAKETKGKKKKVPGTSPKKKRKNTQDEGATPMLDKLLGKNKPPAPKGSLDCLEACIADDYAGDVVACIAECNSRKEWSPKKPKVHPRPKTDE